MSIDNELISLLHCISDSGAILPNNSGTLTVGSTNVFPYPYYDNTVWITPYYSSTPTDKSFIIAKKLLEKKLVQVKGIKQFIELVEAIREIL